MNYDKLIERLWSRARPQKPFIAQGEIWTGGMIKDELCADAATAIETLRADLARVTAERDAAVEKYETEKEDFLDYALSGTQNAAPFCMNRHPDCVDKRGWCIPVKCHGFSRDKDE